MVQEAPADVIWPIYVVGYGQCGSRIASTFSLKPSFVPVMREEFYPVRAAAFDTDEGIRQELELSWGWLPKNEVVILPGIRDEDLNAIIEDNLPERAGEAERWFGRGIGGLPFLGRQAALTALESDTYSEKRYITEGLQNQGFGAGGILLTINSLTGGTGSGFAGPVTKYLVNDVMGGSARVVLNLSIIPSNLDEMYPRNILSGLHNLLMSGLPDGIIIADNDQMSNFQCLNNREYNKAIHEMLMPVLLAPQPKYQTPEFDSSLDGADMKNWLRRHSGFGNTDLCAIGYAKLSRPGLFQDKNQFLSTLVKDACAHTTVECDPKQSFGAVAVLFAHPDFYKKTLNGDAGYYNTLVDCLHSEVSDRLKVACIQSEQLRDVRLTILMSGISPQRVLSICRDAQHDPNWGEVTIGTLGDKIRNLDESYVQSLAMQELRQNLEKANEKTNP